MKLGFSYHGIHDGMNPNSLQDIPDGHRYGRPLFMEEVLKRGHELVCLQKRREDKHYVSKQGYTAKACDDLDAPWLPNDLDVIFMEWRWSTWKNDKTHPQHDPKRYEPDLDRQRALLARYHGKIPIVVWDTDLKITAQDERDWPELVIADPSFKTNRLTRDRVFVPFWTDWEKLMESTSYPYNYGYIGNRYARDPEFEEFYYKPAQFLREFGRQTLMHGNWLQQSPERGDPADLIKAARHVAFGHRMGFRDSMRLMSTFLCTTHVSKPKYYELGFVSPRYLEALAVGCPALVPAGFLKPDILGSEWTVTDVNDVIAKVIQLSRMSSEERQRIVAVQREHMRSCSWGFDVKHAVDVLEDTAGIVSTIPCGTYGCTVPKKRHAIMCNQCTAEYREDPDAFK